MCGHYWFQAFLLEVFWCLFALPSPKQRYLPKCKSMATRSAAFDLMVEQARGSLENYAVLHEIVLKQHTKGKNGADNFVLIINIIEQPKLS